MTTVRITGNVIGFTADAEGLALIEESEAQRLVKLGVAVIVDAPERRAPKAALAKNTKPKRRS